MKSDYLRNNIGRIFLALSFLLGIGLAASPAVQAQRPWDQDQDRQDRIERERRDRDYNRSRNDQYNRNRVYDNRGYNNGNYGGYGGYGNASQVAINQGYQDGLYTGSSDAQRRQSYNPQRSHFYRDGHGSGGYYGGGYGYQQAYRDGFLRGYNEGYRRNGGYNNNGRGSYGRFPW
jgi:hypothetical protein